MADLTKLMNDEINKIADKKADYNFCLSRKHYKSLMLIVEGYKKQVEEIIKALDNSDDMALLGESVAYKADLKRVKKLLKRLKV